MVSVICPTTSLSEMMVFSTWCRSPAQPPIVVKWWCFPHGFGHLPNHLSLWNDGVFHMVSVTCLTTSLSEMMVFSTWCRSPAQPPLLVKWRCFPRICQLNYKPVCGINNQTYSNACGADCDNTEVACQGVCPCIERNQPCICTIWLFIPHTGL
jgi:hypothetical protein